jgi:hypothetical protein
MRNTFEMQKQAIYGISSLAKELGSIFNNKPTPQEVVKSAAASAAKSENTTRILYNTRPSKIIIATKL